MRGAATGKIETETALVGDRAQSAACGIPFRGQDHGKQTNFPRDPIPSNRIALSHRTRLVKGARRTFPARNIGQDRVDYCRWVGRDEDGRRERAKNPRKSCVAAEISVEISPVT
jgi:hypothetical protein